MFSRALKQMEDNAPFLVSLDTNLRAPSKDAHPYGPLDFQIGVRNL